MVKMYRLIKDGLGKAEALRKAQLWLKNPNIREEHLRELERLVPWFGHAAGKGLPDVSRFGRTQFSPEKLLPEDLSHPYYWAGFICTGAP
jgi:CHAT domain-containing protein